MATFFVARTIEDLGGGNYEYTDTYAVTDNGSVDFYTQDVYPVSGTPGGPTPLPIIPSDGEVVFSECIGSTLYEYYYVPDFTVGVSTIADSPTCCSFNSADFDLSVSPDDGSNNGSISVTSSVVDVEDYEYSLNNGAWTPGTPSPVVVSGITGSNEFQQNLRIRLIGGSCFGTFQVVVPLQETVQPPFVIDLSEPSAFMPVFYPIAYAAQFLGNAVDIKNQSGNTVIETDDAGLQAYLATLPNVRIYGSENYDGVYRVLSQLSTTQFVIAVPFVLDETVTLCPSDKQIFLLYCERGFNQFVNIAQLAIAADMNGQYNIRVEGFLQSEFILNPPVQGDEITLGRKYYLTARDFGITTAVTTAVYSAIPSLANYLEEFTPLGPAPMNFINEQTQKGIPVLFSYLNQATGRVVNVISSKDTEIISTNDVSIVGLPCNEYDVQWLKLAGNVNGPLVSDPALPLWITAQVVDNRINLHISTCSGEGGDYSADDYNSDDYLTANFNELVGCHSFDFSDNDGELFTLTICVYPIQQPATDVCIEDACNIAWINREGGWSSYAFAKDRGDKSRKVLGYEIGESTDYKRAGELKKAEVNDVYENASVFFSNKNQREMIFIGSLRRSVQAYLFNTVTKAWDIPIFINIESFPTYSLPFNQATDGNGAFTFKYSNEIRVQRQ